MASCNCVHSASRGSLLGRWHSSMRILNKKLGIISTKLESSMESSMNRLSKWITESSKVLRWLWAIISNNSDNSFDYEFEPVAEWSSRTSSSNFKWCAAERCNRNDSFGSQCIDFSAIPRDRWVAALSANSKNLLSFVVFNFELIKSFRALNLFACWGLLRVA